MMVEANIWTVARTDQGNAVLIRPIGMEVAVPIFIGQLEAQLILIGMGDVHMPRPLSHDLILSLLLEFKAKIMRTEITKLKNGTFYANLIIQKNKKNVVIDARPSDAIAISVRNKTPIYIEDAIVKEAGISIDYIEEEAIQAEKEDKEVESDKLKTALESAIKNENYEKAAEIRDKLNDIEKNLS